MNKHLFILCTLAINLSLHAMEFNFLKVTTNKELARFRTDLFKAVEANDHDKQVNTAREYLRVIDLEKCLQEIHMYDFNRKEIEKNVNGLRMHARSTFYMALHHVNNTNSGSYETIRNLLPENFLQEASEDSLQNISGMKDDGTDLKLLFKEELDEQIELKSLRRRFSQAAAKNDLKTLKNMVTDHPSKTLGYYSALWNAIMCGHYKASKYLLQSGKVCLKDDPKKLLDIINVGIWHKDAKKQKDIMQLITIAKCVTFFQSRIKEIMDVNL